MVIADCQTRTQTHKQTRHGERNKHDTGGFSEKSNISVSRTTHEAAAPSSCACTQLGVGMMVDWRGWGSGGERMSRQARARQAAGGKICLLCVQAGVRYKWVVEVSPSTDSDGWQYARDFKRGVIWSSAFNHQCFVRRRRHRGL